MRGAEALRDQERQAVAARAQALQACPLPCCLCGHTGKHDLSKGQGLRVEARLRVSGKEAAVAASLQHWPAL